MLIPWDCADGFFEAYWRRPEAYLTIVRRGISVWARVGPDAEQRAVRTLRDDLASGRWAQRNRDLVARCSGARPSPARNVIPAAGVGTTLRRPFRSRPALDGLVRPHPLALDENLEAAGSRIPSWGIHAPWKGPPDSCKETRSHSSRRSRASRASSSV